MAERKPGQQSQLKPERVQSQLKPERVQSRLRPGGDLQPERIGERLKSERVQAPLITERIQAKLDGLRGCEAAEDGGALERTYLFPTIRAAVAFVVLVAEIGEANDFLPDIDLRYFEITLRVSISAGSGLTELDFDAARLFDLVHLPTNILTYVSA